MYFSERQVSRLGLSSEHLLMYRGATDSTPKHPQSDSSRVEGRSLPENMQLHYRGNTYRTGSATTTPTRSGRVVNQLLIYRGATYQMASHN